MVLFSIVVQLIAGGYLIFNAIKGKHRTFDLRFPKKDKAPLYRRIARIAFGSAGGLLLLMAAVTIIGNTLPEGHPAISPLGVVLLVMSFLALTILLALLVVRTVMTDRAAQAKGAMRGVAPRAAFFFDEEDKK